jgi:predicted nuclease of restriction endonuclease-like (RecB) superfamily
MIEDDKHIVEYRTWIKALKSKIQLTRIKVALSVNAQLIELYWDLGKDIAEKLESSNWGSKVIEQISTDLKHEFPELKGFSRRNLYAVKQWYQFYAQQYSFVPQAVAQLPWGHNRLIVSRVKDVADAIFYCEATIKNGWSRDVLEMQLDTRLIERSGNATHNFDNTLPEQQSKIASQTFKDPYNFDFLGLHDEALEREIENELTANITEFLLEPGKGFAFVGRQYKIEISETDYYLDLLFYHLDLRSYVVIELKAGKFKPEYAGKLNFYLPAVDSQIKKAHDNPTIGILLCKKKDKIEAEYALRDINKPIGISEYKLTQAIPENIKTQLPSIEELEHDLNEKIEKSRR